MTSYSEQMLSALEDGQLERAQELFAQALREDEDDILYSLAEELYALGFLKQSRRAYRLLLQRYPREDQLRTALADIAIEEGEVDVALDYLAQIPAESDAYLPALLVKADLYQSEGLPEAAEQSLLQAEKLAPDEDVITFALAEYYFDAQSYQKALPRYRDLLSRGVRTLSQVDLVARIGVAYAQTGQYDHAVGYLEQIKPAEQTLAVKFQLAVIYQALERDDDAIKLLQEILDVDANYTSIYPILGQLYDKKHDHEMALRTYQAGLVADQTNPYLYRLAGLAALDLGDAQTALAYFKEALQLDDEDLPSVLALSQLYLRDGQDAENIALLLPFVEGDDVAPELYWQLAQSYARQENFVQADKFYDLAAPDLQENATFLSDVTTWYRENGDMARAASALRAYVALVPEDLDAQFMLQDYDLQGY